MMPRWKSSVGPTVLVAVAASAIGVVNAASTCNQRRTCDLQAWGQVPPPPPSAGSGGDTRGTAAASDRETRRLTLGATGSLELKTFAGDITVVGGSGRDVQVEIVRQSVARTDEEAKAGLKDIRVVTEHIGDHAALSVVSATRRPSARVRVDYTVSVPAGTRVVASTVMGNVSVKGLKGELDVQATSGNITIANAAQVSSARTISGNIALTDAASPGGLALNAVSGNILLERVKTRQLDVDVTTGNVVVKNGAGEQVQIRSLSGSIDYTGPVSRGGRYQLQTHSGELRLLITGGTGFDLQASSFAGEIKADSSLTSKAVGMTPQSLRATVGDGSAHVVAITFSGNVTIGRK